MIHFLTTHGSHASAYQLPIESIGNFKSVVRGIVGGSVCVISNKFKTDIFYESSHGKHLTIVKLWMMYVKRTIEPEDNIRILTYSGDEEALLQYFNSLSTFSRNPLRFRTYLQTFRKAFQSDPKNTLINKVIECDRHVMTAHRKKALTDRETLLLTRNNKPSFPIVGSGWSSIKHMAKRFEN